MEDITEEPSVSKYGRIRKKPLSLKDSVSSQDPRLFQDKKIQDDGFFKKKEGTKLKNNRAKKNKGKSVIDTKKEDTDLEGTKDGSGTDTEVKGVQNSLYMAEKRTKKQLTYRPKKDKGQMRITAYLMWAREVRQELNKQYPEMEFMEIANRLSELWGTVPNTEREIWRRRAKKETRLQRKGLKKEVEVHRPVKFLNRRAATVMRPTEEVCAVEEPPAKLLGTDRSSEVDAEDTDTAPQQEENIQSERLASYFALLGDSMTSIGEKLKNGSDDTNRLSTLMDSLLCSIGILVTLTEMVPQLRTPNSTEVKKKILDNIDFILPME